MTEIEKHNHTLQETGFAIGLNPPPPRTVQIDCDTIILKQRELEISFMLDAAKIKNFDRLTINGITFIKEDKSRT